jgi:hypothetical protein
MTPEVRAAIEDLKAHILEIERAVFGAGKVAVVDRVEDVKAHIINLEQANEDKTNI